MANLDMTLDDMITMNKTSRSGPRPSGPGPTRRYPGRSASRAAPYSSSAARGPESQWDHGMFAAGPAFPARVSSIETGTKLLVSNLHFGVIDEDIEELFSGMGELKSCSIHYDRSGRSEGTAEVVFCRHRDAENAIKRYNNVQLDGMPMRIEIVGLKMDQPPILPPPAVHGRNPRVQGRGGDGVIRRPPQGGFRGMRKDRVGGGSGRGRAEKISAEDLDADLDKYLAEAKGTD
ncbi:THO complex subunit 4a [Phtheirospermum japonicum]|uniref:THO complex subunit 4a n=1 Tax=Phtheirospermum japonicum TaxID=374723 RepID=A0A830CTK6_9LAMI|nr:THO complex subunit 4a [Phtheirospermum japonicum]